jgi:hypothetical protein
MLFLSVLNKLYLFFDIKNALKGFNFFKALFINLNSLCDNNYFTAAALATAIC